MAGQMIHRDVVPPLGMGWAAQDQNFRKLRCSLHQDGAVRGNNELRVREFSGQCPHRDPLPAWMHVEVELVNQDNRGPVVRLLETRKCDMHSSNKVSKPSSHGSI